MRVGLVGPSDREELLRLSIRLEERSAEGVILDSRKNPEIRITSKGETACGVDLSDFSSFYVADLGLPSPIARTDDGEIDREASTAALHYSRGQLAAWNALLARLERRCLVVNPFRTHELHSLKPWETDAYHRMGLPVPLTIATSDPAALLDPPGTESGEWIRKGMVGGCDYTEEYIPPGSLEEARELMRSGPIMIQERINGDNVRAFVLDGEMIGAAEIVTRTALETDSRRGEIRVRKIELPVEASNAAIAAARRWGMVFAAIDFMVEAGTGRYCVLECNSAPFFVNFEKATGLPITSRLAEYLARGRSRED